MYSLVFNIVELVLKSKPGVKDDKGIDGNNYHAMHKISINEMHRQHNYRTKIRG